MICKKILGNINTTDVSHLNAIPLCLEWHELPKRIIRKNTSSGEDIAIKFVEQKNTALQEGDLLYIDDHKAIYVEVNPCDAIEITPQNLYEMGAICYEIGNKHIPIFIKDNKILVPYEKPLEAQLSKTGYALKKVNCKLLNPLRTTVHQH